MPRSPKGWVQRLVIRHDASSAGAAANAAADTHAAHTAQVACAGTGGGGNGSSGSSSGGSGGHSRLPALAGGAALGSLLTAVVLNSQQQAGGGSERRGTPVAVAVGGDAGQRKDAPAGADWWEGANERAVDVAWALGRTFMAAVR